MFFDPPVISSSASDCLEPYRPWTHRRKPSKLCAYLRSSLPLSRSEHSVSVCTINCQYLAFPILRVLLLGLFSTSTWHFPLKMLTIARLGYSLIGYCSLWLWHEDDLSSQTCRSSLLSFACLYSSVHLPTRCALDNIQPCLNVSRMFVWPDPRSASIVTFVLCSIAHLYCEFSVERLHHTYAHKSTHS